MSNKWDAACDVLLISKRVEATSEHQRTPRSYNKRNAQYWENDLFEKRAKHKELRMSISTTEEVTQRNIQQMSAVELKEELKKLGIATRVRNVKRLQEMFEAALNQVV